ncbi:MAG: OmpA family protein [Candidatus Hydrogenedentes bacterium]|nr:OmpA family protein [Candidatus Hydrogenedentota bacterium]
MKRKHAEEEKENEERWLLTYADLITLLMAFFVVMYAMSNVDAAKFKQLSVTLSDAFSNPTTSPVEVPFTTSTLGERKSIIPRPPETSSETTRKVRAEALKSELEEIFRTEGLEKDVTVQVSEDSRKVTIRLAAFLLFEPGSAELAPESMPLIDKLASVLNKAGKPVRVEGHTDNIPINTPQFKSNWQLSSMRASNVVYYIEQNYEMNPDLLSAGGYGEHRPIAKNDSPEGRALNRRVEFVIDLSMEGL